MHQLSDEEINFIENDIKSRGVQLEDLQLNLLDHVCCIIENEYAGEERFELFYQKIIQRFYKTELKEIELETQLLLSNKHLYAMKKTMLVSGTSAVILLISGSIFKLMHWPGAGALLVLGIAMISFIFLPLLFLTKRKDAATSRDKVVMGLGVAVGILYYLSTLFKIMHWPGAAIFWFLTIGLSAFVFIPVFFFTGIRNPETKVNTMVTTILLIGATSILFMMMNIRPAKKEIQLKMYNYLQSEELLNRLKSKQSNTQPEQTEAALLLQEINTDCEQIKRMIFEGTIGEKQLSPDFEAKNLLIEDRSLGKDFYDDKGKGAQLMLHLKTLVNKYNAMNNEKIPEQHSALDADFGNIANYNVFSVLGSIMQIQLYVASARS